MNKDRVILVHGWLGLPYELTKLGRTLAAMGYEVEYARHYSLFGRFESAVDALRTKVLAAPNRPVHIVGFSMGGLIARAAAEACPGDVASLFLIGTPNAGSPFADLLRFVFPTSSVRRLCRSAPPLAGPAPNIRVGCIAGDRPGILGLFLNEPNDSRVTVASAFKVSHTYRVIVDCSHRTLPRHPDVLRHAQTFFASDAAHNTRY